MCAYLLCIFTKTGILVDQKKCMGGEIIHYENPVD